MLTAARLRELLHYDPETGVFTWRVNRGNKPTAGMKAGRRLQSGHLQITIDWQTHAATRIAWLYMTGDWPVAMVDHKNRVASDYRWSNLRAATRLQNQANARVRKDSRSGVKGVSAVRQKFRAKIRAGGKKIHLGYFDTPEDAHAAYVAKAKELFGEFHCAG